VSDEYKGFCQLYTDGSLMESRVACAVVSRTSCESVRLPNNTNIFRAELYAIMLAMRLICKRKEKNFIIFSDSMSSLQALNVFKLELDLIQKVLKDYLYLTAIGKPVILCWIPSHVNIPGNEKADCAAKSALSLPITNMRFSAYDLAPHVSKFCLKEWQDIWDVCQGNKLYAIYRNVGDYQYKSSLSRRDAVIINRLRIGHTRLTHSYLLSGEDQPVCSACQSPLTVKHFLINFAAIAYP